MYDIVALGECLIDFVTSGGAVHGSLLYEGNPGGAPANVLAAASKLGLNTAFIGKVGDDSFGALLKNTLEENRIDTSSLIISTDYPTTLAFVSLDATGNRSFSFYRRETADVNLNEKEIDYELIRKAKLFHFGSVSLTDEPSRTATLAAARFAKKNRIPVSYDPNLREKLWPSLYEAKKIILSAMDYADMVKVSEEELSFLTGFTGLEEGMRVLYSKYQLRFLAVTLGAKGCRCMSGETICSSPAFAVNSVDTTGAGDAFWGAMLYRIQKSGKNPDKLTEDELMRFMDFSNAAGSLATTRRGAIPSLPNEQAILDCIASVPRLQ
jgi:fructokinase